MAKLKQTYFILIFLLGLWIFAGPGGSGPPAQLKESRLPGIDTIDDNVSVLILALLLWDLFYMSHQKTKTPI
jgi:hypothetical protein